MSPDPSEPTDGAADQADHAERTTRADVERTTGAERTANAGASEPTGSDLIEAVERLSVGRRSMLKALGVGAAASLASGTAAAESAPAAGGVAARHTDGHEQRIDPYYGYSSPNGDEELSAELQPDHEVACLISSPARGRCGRRTSTSTPSVSTSSPGISSDSTSSRPTTPSPSTIPGSAGNGGSPTASPRPRRRSSATAASGCTSSPNPGCTTRTARPTRYSEWWSESWWATPTPSPTGRARSRGRAGRRRRGPASATCSVSTSGRCSRPRRCSTRTRSTPRTSPPRGASRGATSPRNSSPAVGAVAAGASRRATRSTSSRASQELGEDGLYAEQDRLLRYAWGNTDEGVTDRGSAWASEDVRDCLADYGHVVRDDGQAHVTFTVADGCEPTMSLAVHSLPGGEFSEATADEQELLGSTTETYGPGEHTISVDLPE